MLDPTALVLSQRLVAEQFSEEPPRRGRPRKDSSGQLVRARAARALRVVADALEPTSVRRTAS